MPRDRDRQRGGVWFPSEPPGGNLSWYTPEPSKTVIPDDVEQLPDGRLILWLAPEEHARINSLPSGKSSSKVAVLDSEGRFWLVWRADCGAGCYCAAKARLVRDK